MDSRALLGLVVALLAIVGVQKVADLYSSSNTSARFVSCKIENGKRFLGITTAERRTNVCRTGKQFASRSGKAKPSRKT